MRKVTKTDRVVERIERCLEDHRGDHPHARVLVRRQNSVSVRVRILDPGFRGLDRVDRERMIWPLLAALPEEAQAEITMLLLLTPGETRRSLANLEFEHPLPSRL